MKTLKKGNFESIKDAKFQKISSEELEKLYGGLGTSAMPTKTVTVGPVSVPESEGDGGTFGSEQ